MADIKPAKSPIGRCPLPDIRVTAFGRVTMRLCHDEDERGSSSWYEADLIEMGGKWWDVTDVLTLDAINFICDMEMADDIQRGDEMRSEAYGRARNERLGITE